ncbi:hypothetical protein [Comamonas sp. JNW]|uniref:hypothetical protein n=1 Tax=Comamonas sp. JNW TaxID=2170731 RepID=UPI000DE62CFD|nr:hypothetical protein [Comamonas sp. JNW]PWB15609.1 hypothetical protein DCO45_19640 [Comamonas sp. JNW]
MSNESNPVDALGGALGKLADLVEGLTTTSLSINVALAKTLLDKGLITSEDFHRNIDLSRKIYQDGKPNDFSDLLINSVKGLTNNDK